MTQSGATTLGQSGPGSDSNEDILCIPQSSSITGASLSDCLVSYPEHSLGKSYLSAEMYLVYSTAAANWAMLDLLHFTFWFLFANDNHCYFDGQVKKNTKSNTSIKSNTLYLDFYIWY